MTLFDHCITSRFDGAEFIEVLPFLQNFVDLARSIDMSEAEAYVIMPFFVAKDAQQQYESSEQLGGAVSHSIEDCPSAVYWLLRTYATNREINKAVDEFRQILQEPEEDDYGYFKRFEAAHARVGCFLSASALTVAYIESVDQMIRPIFREAREENRYMPLWTLCRKAANFGETLPRKRKEDTRVQNLRGNDFLDPRTRRSFRDKGKKREA